MAHRRNRPINLPAPYLKRVWIDPSRVSDPAAYPFCLPFLQREFDLAFDQAITIIVGENSGGKSTLLEGIAAMAGYDEAGGGKGHAGRSFQRGRGDGRPPVVGAARELAAEDHHRMVLSRRELLLGGAISTRRPWKATAGRRTSCRIRMARAFCGSSMSALAAGHFHLRRAGIGVGRRGRSVLGHAPHGSIGNLRSWRPTRRSSWLSGSVPAAVVQVRFGPGDGRGHRPLPAHARVLGRSRGVHRHDAGGMMRADRGLIAAWSGSRVNFTSVAVRIFSN